MVIPLGVGNFGGRALYVPFEVQPLRLPSAQSCENCTPCSFLASSPGASSETQGQAWQPVCHSRACGAGVKGFKDDLPKKRSPRRPPGVRPGDGRCSRETWRGALPARALRRRTQRSRHPSFVNPRGERVTGGSLPSVPCLSSPESPLGCPLVDHRRDCGQRDQARSSCWPGGAARVAPSIAVSCQ